MLSPDSPTGISKHIPQSPLVNPRSPAELAELGALRSLGGRDIQIY